MAWYSGLFRALGRISASIGDALEDLGENVEEIGEQLPAPERKARRKARRQQRKSERRARKERPGYQAARRAERDAERQRAAERARREQAREQREESIRRELEQAGPASPIENRLVIKGSGANISTENERAPFSREEDALAYYDDLIAKGVPPSLISLVFYTDGRRSPYRIYVGYA